MNNIFRDSAKTIEEGQKRWQEIEDYSGMIKKHLETGLKMDSKNTDRLATLVLLLIEHLRPIQPTQEQLDDTMKDISALLSKIGNINK